MTTAFDKKVNSLITEGKGLSVKNDRGGKILTCEDGTYYFNEKGEEIMSNWIWNPKTKGSGIITCIPQKGKCPNKCLDCFFQQGRSYLAPLDRNLPHVPTTDLTKGRIVRMNDGNDSNVDREIVEETARRYDNYFFNTAIPKRLADFPGPVVLTLNPGDMTDTSFHKLDPIPKNLMFVRIRTNSWNVQDVLIPAIVYYTRQGVPCVITYMAYYSEKIPDKYAQDYVWKKRTLNSYWVLNAVVKSEIEKLFEDNPLVYTCGYKEEYACTFCGNCVREYHNTKERVRYARESEGSIQE